MIAAIGNPTTTVPTSRTLPPLVLVPTTGTFSTSQNTTVVFENRGRFCVEEVEARKMHVDVRRVWMSMKGRRRTSLVATLVGVSGFRLRILPHCFIRPSIRIPCLNGSPSFSLHPPLKEWSNSFWVLSRTNSPRYARGFQVLERSGVVRGIFLGRPICALSRFFCFLTLLLLRVFFLMLGHCWISKGTNQCELVEWKRGNHRCVSQLFGPQ
jgi:hypothetical protein